MDLPIGVPVINCLPYTRQLWDSILKQIDRDGNLIPTPKLVVLDQGSSDGTPEWAEAQQAKYPGTFQYVKVDEQVSVAMAWNMLLNYCFFEWNCDYGFIVNNDIIFHPLCISEMANFLEQNNWVEFCFPIEASGMSPGGKSGLAEVPLPVPWHQCGTTYSAYVMKKTCAEKVGSFDPDYELAYFEDNDYEIRKHIHGIPEVKCDMACYFHDGGSQYIKSIEHTPERQKYHDAYAKNRRRLLDKWGHNILRMHWGAEAWKSLGFPDLERKSINNKDVYSENL